MNGAAPERRILSVRELNEEIAAALRRSFPATVWVRGEVQRLPVDAARRQHVYFELHETGQSGAAEYQIPVSLMGWDRQRFGLGRYLDGQDPDLQLANQLEVCLECQVDYYAKFGKLSLKIVGVDKHFSLGRLEARRRQILAHLEQAGLLRLNAGLVLPELPLRVGLITSPGSAAEHDFLSGLAAAPWAFAVSAVGARMQGEQLEPEVIAALHELAARDLDVIVITRGGGSRADLSWFDQQQLAEAIARCRLPVITAIGHEIDRSIADLVAHHSCKTPTAAAEFLVDRVDAAAGRLETAAAALTAAARGLLEDARRRLAVGPALARTIEGAVLRERLRLQERSGRLQRRVAQRLAAAGSQLARRQERLGSGARGALARAAAGDRERSRRLQREALRPLAGRGERLEALAVQARLLDPERLLQRGYTITQRADGSVLTRAAGLAAGETLLTRFADGEIRSIVQPGAAAGGPAPTAKGKGNGRGGKKADPRQKTLFR